MNHTKYLISVATILLTNAAFAQKTGSVLYSEPVTDSWSMKLKDEKGLCNRSYFGIPFLDRKSNSTDEEDIFKAKPKAEKKLYSASQADNSLIIDNRYKPSVIAETLVDCMQVAYRSIQDAIDYKWTGKEDINELKGLIFDQSAVHYKNLYGGFITLGSTLSEVEVQSTKTIYRFKNFDFELISEKGIKEPYLVDSKGVIIFGNGWVQGKRYKLQTLLGEGDLPFRIVKE